MDKRMNSISVTINSNSKLKLMEIHKLRDLYITRIVLVVNSLCSKI